MAAFEAWSVQPTPATEAAWLREKNRDVTFEDHLRWTSLGMLLALDATVIYFFWNHGTRKTGGPTSVPEATAG
jgi:monomeric isocitrate dehydrogenase